MGLADQNLKLFYGFLVNKFYFFMRLRMSVSSASRISSIKGMKSGITRSSRNRPMTMKNRLLNLSPLAKLRKRGRRLFSNIELIRLTILHHALFFSTPVAFFRSGAFVLGLFTFGERDFDFCSAFDPIHGCGHDGIAFSFNR